MATMVEEKEDSGQPGSDKDDKERVFNNVNAVRGTV